MYIDGTQMIRTRTFQRSQSVKPRNVKRKSSYKENMLETEFLGELEILEFS